MPNAELIVENGPLVGTRFPVPAEAVITIGRSVNCDIQIPDVSVSRMHCRVENQGDEAILHDLNSTCGTFRNGKKVTSQHLAPGDHVTVGDTVMRFAYLDAEVAVEDDVAPGGDLAGTISFVPEGRSTDTEIVRQSFDPGAAPVKVDPADDAELRQVKEQLNAICQLASHIYSENEIQPILEVAAQTVLDLSGAERGAILLLDEDSGRLIPMVKKTAHPASRNEEFRISRTVVEETVRSGVSVITADAGADDRFTGGASIVMQNIHSVMCVPLRTEDKIVGAIYADSTSAAVVFDESAMAIIAAVGNQVAIAILNQKLNQGLRKAHLETLRRLGIASEWRDKETSNHIERVSHYCRVIAEELGWPQDRVDNIIQASPMHDVGKVGIPDAILHKPGKLDDEEWKIMKAHAIIGGHILAKADNELMRLSRMIAIGHHEKWNGKGYPQGLKGEEIPLECRVVALADVYDALSCKRCYKPPFPHEKVMGIIQEERGEHFDPDVVDAFLKRIDEVVVIRDRFVDTEEDLKQFTDPASLDIPED